jgi:hypothetical protein
LVLSETAVRGRDRCRGRRSGLFFGIDLGEKLIGTAPSRGGVLTNGVEAGSDRGVGHLPGARDQAADSHAIIRDLGEGVGVLWSEESEAGLDEATRLPSGPYSGVDRGLAP